MSIYRFSGNSAIKDISFGHAVDRPPVALLAASETVDIVQLLAIREALENHGWACVPVNEAGKEVLQVGGFKNPEQLLTFLAQHHFTQGVPSITAEAGDNPKRTFKNWLSQNSLKASGVLNLVGDSALLISGIKNGRASERNAGIFYTLGGLTLVGFGNAKGEHHLRQVSERTADFMQKQLGALPDNTGLSSVAQHKRTDALTNTRNLMYRYPTQVTLGAYTAGAACMLKSGIQKGLNHEGWAGAGYGISSTALKVLSFIIPEKPKTLEDGNAKEHKNIFQSFTGWVQEKPLRLFGYGSLVSEIFLGIDAYDEYKLNPRQKSFVFKGITTGTYICADLLMAMSNKNHVNGDGKFDHDEQHRIEGLAAETIARQPLAQHETLANDAGGFLSAQGEMNGNAIDISRSILDQVKHMAKNPWAVRTSTEPALQLAR